MYQCAFSRQQLKCATQMRNGGRSDVIGGCIVAEDTRWAGTFGISADFVAKSHCSVELITIEDIKVPSTRPVVHLQSGKCGFLLSHRVGQLACFFIFQLHVSGPILDVARWQ